MPKPRSAFSIGRLVAKAKALWDFYWYVIVQGALWLDGKWQDRKRKGREKKKRKAKRPE